MPLLKVMNSERSPGLEGTKARSIELKPLLATAIFAGPPIRDSQDVRSVAMVSKDDWLWTSPARGVAQYLSIKSVFGGGRYSGKVVHPKVTMGEDLSLRGHILLGCMFLGR